MTDPPTRRDIVAALAALLALSCEQDAGGTPPATFEDATRAVTAELQQGMPWETVRAKVIRAKTVEAISVHATVRLSCPDVRRVPYAPVPKNTGGREFARLDVIEVDRLEAHHIEAAEIVADEIVAVEVTTGPRRAHAP